VPTLCPFCLLERSCRLLTLWFVVPVRAVADVPVAAGSAKPAKHRRKSSFVIGLAGDPSQFALGDSKDGAGAAGAGSAAGGGGGDSGAVSQQESPFVGSAGAGAAVVRTLWRLAASLSP
jgi:hypothetical protein